jgi:hypothetical protein
MSELQQLRLRSVFGWVAVNKLRHRCRVKSEHAANFKGIILNIRNDK